MKNILLTLTLALALSVAETRHDIVVYGGTSGGVTAAVQAAKMGKSVVLISDYGHLGGLSSSGLGATDIGDSRILGGLSKEFYQRVSIHYNGGTSGGIIAAIQAAKSERSVVLVSPTPYLGGLTTSGLGWTDLGSDAILGGFSREFHTRVPVGMMNSFQFIGFGCRCWRTRSTNSPGANRARVGGSLTVGPSHAFSISRRPANERPGRHGPPGRP